MCWTWPEVLGQVSVTSVSLLSGNPEMKLDVSQQHVSALEVKLQRSGYRPKVVNHNSVTSDLFCIRLVDELLQPCERSSCAPPTLYRATPPALSWTVCPATLLSQKRLFATINLTLILFSSSRGRYMTVFGWA